MIGRLKENKKGMIAAAIIAAVMVMLICLSPFVWRRTRWIYMSSVQPNSLKECCRYLDVYLLPSEKRMIKEMEKAELVELYYGLSMSVGSCWFDDVNDELVKPFLDGAGKHQPECDGALVVYGYWLYLNGRPCSLQDIYLS